MAKPRFRLIQLARGGGVDGRSPSWAIHDQAGYPTGLGLCSVLDGAKRYVEHELGGQVSEIRPLSPPDRREGAA